MKICGDSHGNIELRPGQSWVVPTISHYVKITHARYIDSARSFVTIDIDGEQYGLPIFQRTWYDVGPIRFNGDVQIRNKRLNHICVIVPDSWAIIVDPLELTGLTVELFPEADDPAKGLIGVLAKTTVVGSGEGTMEIKWGDILTETFYVSAGQIDIGNSLPPGTHTICGRMI